MREQERRSRSQTLGGYGREGRESRGQARQGGGGQAGRQGQPPRAKSAGREREEQMR